MDDESSTADRLDDAIGRYRLVRSSRVRAPIAPSPEQQAVIRHEGGRLKVLAGPGTGKTTTLVEAIADRIEHRRVDPSALLVLTFSRRAAADLSARVAERLETTTTEPIVRTLHSFAYAIARNAAAEAGEMPPRLLEAGQADMMVRDILAGHADDGGRYWPPALHAALRVASFASELRELMLRASERQISPSRIAELGRRRNRPEWVAVARFIEEYRQIGDLRQGTTGLGSKLDQAELTTTALECLAEPAALAALRRRIRRVFVDEYQDVDPAQAALIDLLAAGADELVVVGDPDQSIYGFRGATAGAMSSIETDAVVNLTVSRRMPPVLVAATRGIAARIPGPNSHRDLLVDSTDVAGCLEVRTLSTANQEAALVADRLRRLHIESGFAYSSMAVVMRAPSRNGEAFRRALITAGVPVTVGNTAPLAEDPLVASFLMLLRIAVEPENLDSDAALSLLLSPLGQMDVLSVRRLRRAVRSAATGDPDGSAAQSGVIIARMLLGMCAIPTDLADDLSRGLRSVRELVEVAVSGRAEAAAETLLWRLWQVSGLGEQLSGDCERGGDRARRASNHLDAIMVLFDRAADLAAQLPAAGVGGLIEIVADETVSAPAAARVSGESITIVSAHASKGLEWDVVAVVGVQDDEWPDLRPRTSLLSFGELFDAVEGIGAAIPAPSQLADERRLFYVAATRARKHLIVTAIDNSETVPSRFLYEIAGGADAVVTGWPRDAAGRPRRALNLASLVAELRAAAESDAANLVVEPASGSLEAASATGSESDAHQPAAAAISAVSKAERAADVLAMLAEAGVRGADPTSWYGLADATSDKPLVANGAAVTLSPSQVESLMQCPLRTALTRNGGRTDPGQSQLVGVAVHALAEGMAAGASQLDMDTAIEEFLAAQDHLPGWEVTRLRRRMQAMRHALETWLESQSGSRTFLGSELLIDVTVPSESDTPIRMRGRIDWLSRDREGRVVVTDFKTGATVPSVADGESHPQLAVYQLAVALGALTEQVGTPAVDLGGAELVYVAAGSPKIRVQSAQTVDTGRQWVEQLHELAADAIGPRFLARQGDYCSRCPVRSSCPIQPEGRQVTR
ncbi:MAG: ATP-dependent DNA helicase [Nakamurella sp.]